MIMLEETHIKCGQQKKERIEPVERPKGNDPVPLGAATHDLIIRIM